MKNVKIIFGGLFFLSILVIGYFLLDSNSSSKLETLDSKLEEMEKSVSLLKEEKSLVEEENTVLKEKETSMDIEKSELMQQIKTLDQERISQLSEVTGLVNIQDIDDTFVLDLRYATDNNFVGKKVYSVAICLLQEDTAVKLKNANSLAKKDGYRIKIWDGYRPLDAQKAFWEITPDPRYVSDPNKGTDHNRGTAVDITLVDESGKELEMPTGFDEFAERAWRSYQGNTPEAQKNMEYLTNIMVESGFKPISTEWWHYKDTNEKSYPYQNVQLDYFSPKFF